MVYEISHSDINSQTIIVILLQNSRRIFLYWMTTFNSKKIRLSSSLDKKDIQYEWR